MRLLFSYTEFLNRDGTEKFHRGFSRLSLNFSTDRRFSYHDGTLSVTTLERPIPTSFFGDRIYNISTLVGDNGVGKTTILHYLINLLRQLYEGRYCGSDRGFLVVEDQKKTYVLEYHGRYQLSLHNIPNGIERIPFRNKNSTLLSTTKLIYLSNTMTNSDLELVQKQSMEMKNQYVNHFHFRYEFLYNCSTASLMIENCQNDIGKSVESAAEYLNCFFLYEQYKQVKYVFDQRQYGILKKLRRKGHPVPVPQKLVIELQCTDYSIHYKHSSNETNCINTLEDQYDWLLYNLCISCVNGFLKSVRMNLEMAHHVQMINERPIVQWTEFLKGDKYDRKELFLCDLMHIHSSFYKFQEEKNKPLITGLYHACADFLKFIIDEKEHLIQYFEMDSLYEKLAEEEKRTITFSIKTTGKAATWFITFLQKYRYTCEPYYYLQFHWGLSSGEQNLLRLFSSLYYIFDADYNNPECGEYKIYNAEQGHKRSCDSVLLLIDEADLTYHPEWQRCFLAILTSFLPEIYPKTCCQEIQLFLTTHSPIMLGDSPAQSVIYLSKNPDGHISIDDSGLRQTFGENLYMLLQGSFHVQNGALGELVRIKIQEILSTLKKTDDELLTWSKSEKVSLKRVRYRQRQLQSYKKGTISFLADGIIKAKLEKEINLRLQGLEEYISTSRNKPEPSLAQYSDADLKKQLKVLTDELARRKEGF